MKLALRTLIVAGGEIVVDTSAQDRFADGGQRLDSRLPDGGVRYALPGAPDQPVEAPSCDCRPIGWRAPVIVHAAHPVACARAARLLAGRGFPRIYHPASRGDAGAEHDA
jgi:hypothetical protein